MKRGYRMVSLGEIAEIQQGYTFKEKYQGKSTGKWNYYKVADIGLPGNGKYLTTAINRIDDDVLALIGAKPFKKGSIVFPRVGAALRNNNKKILAQDSVTDENVFIITVINGTDVDNEYLFYWFERNDLSKFCNDGLVPVINGTNLKKQKLDLPPFSEQKAISSLLSTWDAAIEKTEWLIAAKEGAYRALLDRLVFSDRNSAWKEMRLGDAFRERNETQCSDLPLLSISREEGITLREDTNRKDTSTEDKSKYLRICPGDIGYNTMRMWQGVSALSRLEGIVSPAYTVCIPNGEMIDGVFASYLFKHPWMIHQFYRHSQGLTSDTWNLKFHHFAEIKTWLPPVPKQRAIAAELSLAGKEIALLKLKAEALCQQKRGLMQKLLTGEWRIRPEIVRKFEEAQDE